MAMTAESAYETLSTNAPQAWLPVQDAFSLPMIIATQTIPAAAQNCNTYLQQNMEVNIDRMVQRTTAYDLDTTMVANMMIVMIEDQDPDSIWLTEVSKGIPAGDEFYYYCYNCTGFV